ncbi:MAG: cation transporter [Bacteroidetes bacterium]|nr:cation transporter [Bacteroidota bacterium]NCQ12072.1 cation transporter [Bacteroidota bacterium]
MEHNHNHSHAPSAEAFKTIGKAFIWGISLNILYVLIELSYGFSIDSTSLISDAIHNIGDISGLILAYIAFRLSSVKSGKIFSYGFKKGSILASFINSVLLAFSIGIISWEGFDRILHPVPINGITVMIVAGIGIIINGFSAYLFMGNQENDLNVKAAYWHLLADAMVSMGVVVSGIIMYFTQWYFIDGIVTLIIALVILISTWNLFKDSLIGILDGTPNVINADEITEHFSKIDGVKEVHHIHIWSLSTQEIALTAHLVIDSLELIPTIKRELKSEAEEHGIKHCTLEFELFSEQCTDLQLK